MAAHVRQARFGGDFLRLHLPIAKDDAIPAVQNDSNPSVALYFVTWPFEVRDGLPDVSAALHNDLIIAD